MITTILRHRADADGFEIVISVWNPISGSAFYFQTYSYMQTNKVNYLETSEYYITELGAICAWEECAWDEEK